ncbi:hypothetical protein [Loktanella sp. S4079]|uniref:hypothetical protein n=1 Tax=Loktanella sp. S4079 TaxID=579483 RepID=UPI0005FA446E|nr:hypothetical protein [Loktanella sp. S4079]KJZ20414.1 hypothetical protein TW80_06340 [Loktanella sp. S4079]
MKRLMTGLSLVALAACTGEMPDFRPGMSPEPAPVAAAPMVNPMSAKERFVTVVEQNGCVMNESNAALVLSEATLSADDLKRVMTELKAEGRGQIAADQRSFEIVSANCQ